MDNFNKIDKEKYLSHINDLEQIKNMNRILDIVEIVIKNYTIQTTDFLDPFSIKVAKSILNRLPQIGYSIFGGYENAERQIVIIYPDYHYFTSKDSNLLVFRLEGNMDGLSHKDFLGGIMGTGINRSKVGDIILHENYADIIVKSELGNYIYTNLEKIGRNNFEIREVSFDDIVYIEDDFKLKDTTIASLRLDSYISTTYNLSRSTSQNIITANNVKVNFEPINKISYEIKEGDLISVRRYGRSILYKLKGISKKDKFKIQIKLYL